MSDDPTREKTANEAAVVSDSRSDGGEVRTALIAGRDKFSPVVSLLLALVWLYQKTLSPVLPAVFGSACGCRFSPTCSHYAADAVRAHGAIHGTWLAIRRLLKCSPLHPGGFDPVPPIRSTQTPRCTRVSA